MAVEMATVISQVYCQITAEAVCGLCHKLIWHGALIWQYRNLANETSDYEAMTWLCRGMTVILQVYCQIMERWQCTDFATI